MMESTTLSKRFPLDGIALGVLFAVVPLAFFPKMADAFLLDKTYLALAAVAFLLLGWGGGAWRRAFALAPVRWAAGFLAWMLLTSPFTALAPGEVIPALWAPLLFTVSLALGAGADAANRAKALFFMRVGVWIVALLGLAQAVGLDTALSWTSRFDGRVFSTFGNPDYLAGYLAALLPLTLCDWAEAATPKEKAWRGTTVVLLLATLALTAVRGAFLALGAALAAVALLAAASPLGREWLRRRKVVWISVAVLALAALGILMVRQGGFSAFSFSGETAQQRFETWRVAGSMAKDHPVAGVGWGNFKVRVPSYQWRVHASESTAPVTEPYTLTDHVHNEFLQVLAEGGLVGLILFVGIWASGLRVFAPGGARGPFEPGALGVFGACVATLVFSFSNFPLQLAPVAVTVGWLLGTAQAPPPNAGPPALPPGRRWFRLLFLGAALAFACVDVASSVAYRDTVGEAGLGNWESSARYANRMMSLPLRRYRVCFEAGQSLSQAGSSHAMEASAAFGEALAKNPVDPQIHLGRATMAFRGGDLEGALTSAEKGIALAPNLHGLWFVKGSALFQQKRYAEAEDSFHRASVLLPTDFDTFLNLGVAQVVQGKKEEALQSWSKALALRPGDTRVAQYIESLHIKR